MNSQIHAAQEELGQRLLRYAIFCVALVLAIAGILNSMPNYGIPIPSPFNEIPIGPYPSMFVRPIVVGTAVFLVIASNPFSRTFAARWPHLKWLGHLTDVAVLGLTWYVLWVYFDVAWTEDREGIVITGWFHFWISILAALLLIILSWKTWGSPLSIVAVVALFYFYTGDQPLWPGIFKTAPVDFIATSEDLWFNLGDGILGTIMSIIIFTVFPFILLGTMLERTGGGRSLIKLAVKFTKNFRGGPAHSAILASGLFGTMSGGAVTNVVATGVITIPMIKQRGFSPEFAGGVESTASSAGQIMPPIMGAAAFVMSDVTGIPYLTIILAALLPALAYYASLFTSVVFEARRLGVEVGKEELDDPALQVTGQDYINLIMVIVPIIVVVVALLQGFSAAGAGMTAFFTIIPLSFLNPEVRNRPQMILEGLAHGGLTFSRLLMAIGVVGIIVAVLSATGLPDDFVIIIREVSGGLLFVTLIFTGLAALLLGMGMPTLPAYLTIVLILGPAMQDLGLSLIVAHLFVLYYGVASSITPPVAVAAYAAASIAEGAPIKTAVTAMRVGLVKFAVPFVFAYYPILLLVPEARPGSEVFDWPGFISIMLRLMFFIYLISSAVIAFDQRRLPYWEIATRLVLALGLIYVDPLVHWPVTVIAVGYMLWHHFAFNRAPSANATLG